VLVDTALGIIVRSEQIFAGQTLEVAELTDLVIDPPQIHNPPLAPDPSCSGRHQACRASQSPTTTNRTNPTMTTRQPLGRMGLAGMSLRPSLAWLPRRWGSPSGMLPPDATARSRGRRGCHARRRLRLLS